MRIQNKKLKSPRELFNKRDRFPLNFHKKRIRIFFADFTKMGLRLPRRIFYCYNIFIEFTGLDNAGFVSHKRLVFFVQKF